MALVKLLTLLCIVFTTSYPFADSTTENKIDRRQLERELKALNKPPIKTIKTKEGDIIDCVDIYKQPTLDHPSFKNHTIQVKPTVLPKNDKIKISATRNARKIPGTVDCPLGTVPIRRTSKEDLIRAKSFFNKITTNIHPLTGITPGKHQAIIRSVPGQNVYTGIQATFSIHNPSVLPGQSSTSQMWIESGLTEDTLSSIQFGWMVNPDLYGDNQTRSFAFWNDKGHFRSGGSYSKGCFNLLCMGFIQTDPSFVLGGVLPYSSYEDHPQDALTFRIMQDYDTGEWWLMNPTNNMYVGYWRRALVPHMHDAAWQVAWGGQTFADTSGASPGMGCGHFPPDFSFLHGCYTMNMKVIDATSNYLVDPEESSYPMESFVDNTGCYNLKFFGNNFWPVGYSFLFGGPGGKNCEI